MAVPRTMKSAVGEEDFRLWDEGKRSVKSLPKTHPEPKDPEIDRILTLDMIDIDKISLGLSGRRKVKRNPEGMRFIGFDVSLKMKTGKDVEGWMPESDYLNLRRILFRDGAVNVDNLEY